MSTGTHTHTNNEREREQLRELLSERGMTMRGIPACGAM